MWMVPRRLFSGLFGLLCCGGDRKGRRLLSKKARILTGRRPKVTVKVDGGVHRTHSNDCSSPISVRTDFFSEDGYESATSELHYPDGIVSPIGSPLSSGLDTLALAELDVIQPEPPTTGCIGKRPPGASKLYVCTSRPRAGSSVRQYDGAQEAGSCSVEAADGQTFMVRGVNYMKDKVKVPSEQAIYRLLGADIYSFDFKISHIAQHVQLPKPPRLGPGAAELPPGERLPPILVINLQLPMYSPTLFGGNDGPGHSLVYYFALPEGWEPGQVANKEALGLLQRFFHDGREFDGQPTRDRLKFIPRIVNVEEWAVKGPLSGYEHRLLNNYNDKPLLTRPQQRFFRGEHYFEIDMDVHNYAYFARKVFFGFINRLAPVVFENSFVVQGNRPEELPEQIMAAVRVHRVDFTRSRPFPAQTLEERGLLQHRATDPGGPGSSPGFVQAAAEAVAEADAAAAGVAGSGGSGSAGRPHRRLSGAGGASEVVRRSVSGTARSSRQLSGQRQQPHPHQQQQQQQQHSPP